MKTAKEILNLIERQADPAQQYDCFELFIENDEGIDTFIDCRITRFFNNGHAAFTDEYGRKEYYSDCKQSLFIKSIESFRESEPVDPIYSDTEIEKEFNIMYN